MCGACGVLLGGERWDELIAEDSQIRRLRLMRLAYMKKLLRAARVSIDDCHGQLFQLTGPTGKCALVPTISAVWSALQGVGGVPIDPLNSDYLSIFKS